MAIDTPLSSPMEEPAMILNRWYRQPSVPASNGSGTIDRLRRGRGARRRRSQPPSCEVLEARQLLAHATIAPAIATHPVDGGSGRDRLVFPKSLEVIQVGPSVSGAAIRILSGTHTLRPLRAGADSPTHSVIVGPAALENRHILHFPKRAYDAGETVGVARARP